MNCKLFIFALCTSVLFVGSLVGQDGELKQMAQSMKALRQIQSNSWQQKNALRSNLSKAVSFQLNRMMAAVDVFPDPYVGADTGTSSELDAFEKLGVTFKEIEDSYVRWQLGLNNEMGLFIHEVHSEGFAQKSKLQNGDLIYQVGLGGERINVKSAQEFIKAVDQSRNNDLVVFFKRDSVQLKTKIRLEEFDKANNRINADYRIGVRIDEMTEILQQQLQVENGVVVISTTEDGPAKAAGIKANDIVIAIDGVSLGSKSQLSKIIDSSGGKELDIQILRGGKQKSVPVAPVLVPPKKSDSYSDYSVSVGPAKQYSFQIVPQEGVPTWRISPPTVSGSSSDAKISTLIGNVERLTEQIKKLESEVANLKSDR